MRAVANYTAPPSLTPLAKMCLILLAYRVRPETPLIVAANRDEFYDRPAQCAHFWTDAQQVLAGRDETAGGTWLGVDRRGRFAAVTNFAAPGSTSSPPVAPNGSATLPPEPPTANGEDPATRSRGALTSDFLRGTAGAADYAKQLHGSQFQGFNLLLWDGETLVCTSNRGPTRTLAPGYHGITNAPLDARWPKVVDGIERLRRVVEQGPAEEALIDLLHDGAVPADARLPNRGQPLQWERRVAPCFIVGDGYGTRASTAVIGGLRETALTEQSYGSGGRSLKRVRFRFTNQLAGS